MVNTMRRYDTDINDGALHVRVSATPRVKHPWNSRAAVLTKLRAR